jgi:membrane protease YdiL (CAAX protease family)
MSKYKNLLDNYKLNTLQVIFLSICAGVGEEIFFRGALQPILGIWVTSIFFVAIHSYFSIKDMRVNIFAIMLTLFIALLGWASQTYSIWLAIVAHFSYDLVLLFYYKNNQM